MNESFVASVKMITGEEVLCEVMPGEEEGQEFYIFQNPIIFDESSQVDTARGVVLSGLIPKKWMMFTNQDLAIVKTEHVITMSELDNFGVEFYHRALVAARASTPIKRKVDTGSNSGFMGKIDSLRESLNKVFKESPDLPNQES
jgi:hypothetical protein